MTEEKIRTAAEFAFIQRIMRDLRYYWRPSYSCGPQYGGWVEQQNFMRKMSKIANKLAKEERANKW